MRYLFGDCSLDTQRYELRRGGAPIPLRPKVYEALAFLLKHHDRVVLKQELLEHLWPEQAVGDAALNSYIMDIRKALGDNGDGQRLLRTIRGRGYRWMIPVEIEALPLPSPSMRTAAETTAPPSSATPATPIAPAADSEYKLASILCGALSEAPALVARLGPELWYRLRQTAMGLIQEVLLRYGGALILATHDGFTAVFGAPLAQEDHARRAVLAAFDLRQRLRDDAELRTLLVGDVLSLSMGLDSGLVVAGELGQEPQRLATVVGAPRHVATQLQQQAAPGTILLSKATYQFVHAEIRATPCRCLTLDGQSTPVSVYAVQGLLRHHAGVAGRGPRAQSPFVGRERELALLQEHLVAVVGGQGQVVGVVGAPGMGKTRLLAEFCRRVSGDQVAVYEGQCLSYGQGTPYLPVRDLVQQLCGLAEGAEIAVHATAVHQQLHDSGITSEDDAALVLQLLDLPVAAETLAGLSPEARQVRTFALLRHLVWEAAQRQPLVLVVENLHWIDPTSAAWLASLVERLSGSAVLLLGTYRPGYQPAWGEHAAVTQVALSPLRAPESGTIVQAVLGEMSIPEAQRQAVVAKARGNPFFLEELAWHAVEQGGQDTPGAVPETVHAVLAERMDRLPLEAKRLLQTAAVIGSEVPVPLLQALTELPEAALHRGLMHLQAAEFLHETRLFPEPVYTFKHALTHEVAYSSLLQVRRRTLHARIVEILAAFSPDRLAEQVDRLAHHALRGEVWDKAVTFCRQIGARANDHAAFGEARVAFEQALEALEHLHEDGDTQVMAIDLRLAMGDVLTPLGEHGRRLALLGEAETLARALDDRAWLGRVLVRRGDVLRVIGDANSAIAALQQALALAVELGEPALEVQASHFLGRAYYFLGDFRQAEELLRWNMEAADRQSGPPSAQYRIRSQAWLARTLSELGAFTESRRHGEEALRLANLVGRGVTPITAHVNLGRLCLAQGDLEYAVRVLDQGRALCHVSGNRTLWRQLVGDLGYAMALQGHLADGRVLLEEAISESIRTGARQSPNWIAQLSEVCRLAGFHEEACQHAHQALALARQQHERGGEAQALHQLGAVLAHADPPEVVSAETHYQQALALAEGLGMHPLQAHCHLGLGRLYAQSDRREQAHTSLTTAIDLYRMMGMTFWLPQAEGALFELSI